MSLFAGVRLTPSSRVRLLIAAALDLTAGIRGFALGGVGVWLYVVHVAVVAVLLTGTLRGSRLVAYIWLGLLVASSASQLIPPIQANRLPVALVAGVAAWLVFFHVRGIRLDLSTRQYSESGEEL